MSPPRPIINLPSSCFLTRERDRFSLNEQKERSHARSILPYSPFCPALSCARGEMRPKSEESLREQNEDDNKVTKQTSRLHRGFLVNLRLQPKGVQNAKLNITAVNAPKSRPNKGVVCCVFTPSFTSRGCMNKCLFITFTNRQLL